MWLRARGRVCGASVRPARAADVRTGAASPRPGRRPRPSLGETEAATPGGKSSPVHHVADEEGLLGLGVLAQAHVWQQLLRAHAQEKGATQASGAGAGGRSASGHKQEATQAPRRRRFGGGGGRGEGPREGAGGASASGRRLLCCRPLFVRLFLGRCKQSGAHLLQDLPRVLDALGLVDAHRRAALACAGNKQPPARPQKPPLWVAALPNSPPPPAPPAPCCFPATPRHPCGERVNSTAPAQSPRARALRARRGAPM